MKTNLKLAVALIPSLLSSHMAFAEDKQDGIRFRPPAVPLVTCDPYFSIWSNSDLLTASPTHHWTGHPHRLTSLVRIDGQTFRVMGDAPANVPALRQVSLNVTPTRSIYTFEGPGAQIQLTFMTPLLPDDLVVCSRPVSYITWTAHSTDAKPHEISVYLDAAAELAVNTPDQAVKLEPVTVPGLLAARVGSIDQAVLAIRGDDLRIDWGHFYLATDASSQLSLAPSARTTFASGAPLAASDSAAPSAQATAAHTPAMAVIMSLGQVNAEPVSRHAILAYDDEYSIRYFNDDLRPYWRKDGATAADLLQTAEKQYESLNQRCEAFDTELIADLHKIGGDSYVQLGVLAWRQALAAQKICADANGQPLSFSKENFSNGCIATVDVLYPAAPQMMVFSPNLLKASLVPLMDYSASPRWTANAAPHDLGTYPHATGQVYGDGTQSPMPVEETGNMLILLAGLAKAEGNAEFSRKYWPVLKTWNEYLVAKGLDPENQLCTDDFAGHIARNANLSAKAIMGIAGYGMLAEMLGQKDEAAKARATAKEYALKWIALGQYDDHFKLVFGDAGNGTWSQKYNLVWDQLLDLGIFPPEVAEKEMAFYMKKMNKFGLPLDSRREYTKIDWELWTATMADKHADFQRIVDACALWANQTPDRVPLSDWYETVSAKKSGFQARSVVGGLFIPFLKDKDLWKKYSSRDKTTLAGWAATNFMTPEVRVVIPTAQTEAAIWRYTTAQPPADWTRTDFNDKAWKQGKAGFGSEGTPGAHVGTAWNSEHIYLRREFTLPEAALTNARLMVHHDEDVEVFINGVLAYHAAGFTADYNTAPIAKSALATLKPGINTLAVRCRQTIGGQYVDVGIVELMPQEKK